MAVPIQKQLWTIEEFERAWDDGAFPPDARLELIRGEIVEMSPIGGPHIAGVVRLITLLSRLFPRVQLSPQNPLRISGRESIPQPDLVVIGPRVDLAENPPTDEDAFLVIEVADSSLLRDRRDKIPLYAEAGIPESWLVDLNSGTLFVHRHPSPAGYQDVRAYRRGESVFVEALPEVRFTVDEILG